MVLNKGLLELEQGSASPGTINNIFRAAHTLKGSSRMLGLENIGAIAHKMEDIFKAVENKELEPEAHVVDLLFKGMDTITRLLDPDAGGEVETENVIKSLDQVFEKKPSPAAEKKKKPAKKARKKAVPEEEPVPPEEELEFSVEQKSPEPPLAAEPEDKPPPEKQEPETQAVQKAADTLRVDVARLDRMVDLSGELTINKGKIESKSHIAKQMLDNISSLLTDFDSLTSDGSRPRAKAQLQEIRNACYEFVQELSEDVVELDMNVGEIQNSALNLRMTPASSLFDEFPRLVRDLSRDLGKKARIIIQGEDTEVDKRLLEQLRGPLVHLIRNACDHGIESPEQRMKSNKTETGTITLKAYHHGATVVIEVIDDGAGMDAERIKNTALTRGIIDEKTASELNEQETYYLALMPGFSTSEIITDLSGRGVGLDVVKNNVEALRGDMNIESSPGQGTKIELRLPLTVSIIEVLLVMQGGELYAIPLPSVEGVVRTKVSELVVDRGRETLPVHGQLLSLIRLKDLLGLPPLPGYERDLRSSEDALNVVILKFRNQRLALEVDGAMREQEIMVKTTGAHIKKAPMVSGATILRKGEPTLILNVFDIFERAEKMEGKRISEIVSVWEKEQRPPRILVVDDSITTRTIEKSILERSGYEVVTAVDGEQGVIEIEKAEPMFDLFVIDIDMPGMNGFELTEKIRQGPGTGDLPVIILTSRASDDDKRRGINVGAQAYIVKGAFDQNVLLDTVRSLIGD